MCGSFWCPDVPLPPKLWLSGGTNNSLTCLFTLQEEILLKSLHDFRFFFFFLIYILGFDIYDIIKIDKIVFKELTFCGRGYPYDYINWLIHLCVHSVINTMGKDKTGWGKGQGWELFYMDLSAKTSQVGQIRSVLRKGGTKPRRWKPRVIASLQTLRRKCAECARETAGHKQDRRRATGRVSQGGGIKAKCSLQISWERFLNLNAQISSKRELKFGLCHN